MRIMTLKKGRVIAAAACAVALAGTIGIAASFTSQGSAEATVRTGVVGIELAEVAPQPDRLLVTGSPVETDTSVTNTGEDAWIRCRVDYSVDGGVMGKAQWTGGEAVDCEGWMLADDGWWYLTEPVESGSTLPFETIIAFPVFEQVAEGDGFVWKPVTGEIDNAKWKAPSPDPDDDAALMTYCGAEGSVLTETVTAHAVQAKNFEPDFDAASPWGDVEVEGTDVSASKEAR